MRYATNEAPRRQTVAMTLSTGVDFVDDFVILLPVVMLERSKATSSQLNMPLLQKEGRVFEKATMQS
jgi:hypothetical protein